MSYSNNSRIRIAELMMKNGVEDDNLIIVEDREDTKKTTVKEFKKNLNGDAEDPSDSKFYTSEHISELHQGLRRDINTKASQKDVDEIRKKIDDITASAGEGKDTELVAARNGKASLSERLDFDREISDSKYMEKLKRTAVGKTVDIKNHHGYIDISIIETKTRETRIDTGKLIVSSRNVLDYSKITEVTDQIKKNDEIHGFDYTQKTNGSVTVALPLSTIIPAGQYVFYSIISFNESFVDKSIVFSITYSDGTIEQLPYKHEETFKFEAKKGFNKISLVYNGGSLVDGAKVSFKDIMIISSSFIPETYIPYHRESHTMNIGDNLFDFYNDNYLYESNIQNGNICIEYHDNDISTEWLYNEVTDLRQTIENQIDRCGMVTDYGIYQFLNNMYAIRDGEHTIVEDGEYDFIRNGVPSKKITITETANRNTCFRIPLDNPIDIIDTLAVQFYIDKTMSSTFTAETGGLKIRLCSDNIAIATETNYYEYLIKKNEMVQGWNFVKRRLVEFTSVGNPDPNAIQYIYFEICRSDETNKRSMYLNSFVFNQKIKPTVLLCLNGTYDESITYLYPYLQTRGIKPTIFLNGKRTLTPAAEDALLGYKTRYGWDLGTDGVHPNKEIMIEDDNFRNQYTALKDTKEWIGAAMCNSPISYSAPYGNLRPITVPILRDLGYKIAKTEASSYCSFFSEKDFALPMFLISNNVELDDIIDKIDYAIESNQVVVLYTNDVTEYGSEIDSKKVIFESVVDYIYDRVKEGKIECLTFSEFYHRCVD